MDAADATEAVVATGRRAGDGVMRLAIFTRELLELTVEARGERASTLLLTPSQIAELQQTLTRLGAQLGATVEDAANKPAADNNGKEIEKNETKGLWNGTERRNTGSLSKS